MSFAPELASVAAAAAVVVPPSQPSSSSPSPAIPQSEADWRARLTPAEFAVLRLGQTESASNGGYTKTTDEGVYVCKGCDAPLYDSKTKFHSGCGWPAFWAGIDGAIKRVPHTSGSSSRPVELRCARCDSHLGHVFDGARFHNPVPERHCINSCCLQLNPRGAQ
jgi:peptide-methionine (R)-S-oxide reductase